MKMLGVETRFEVHALMKRFQREGEAVAEEYLRHDDLLSLLLFDEAHPTAKLSEAIRRHYISLWRSSRGTS